MTSSAAARSPSRSADQDNVIVLRGATWADYERLREIRGDRSAPRISFLDGAIEIMSPSRGHESIESRIASLVEAYCLERDDHGDRRARSARERASLARGSLLGA